MNYMISFLVIFCMNLRAQNQEKGISEKAQALIGTNHEGGNCLNASMIALGGKVSQLFISSIIFEDWRKSDLACDSVDRNQSKAGDLISIHELHYQGPISENQKQKDISFYKSNGLESPLLYIESAEGSISKYLESTIHSAVFTASDRVFEKPGASSSHGEYQVINVSKMYKYYFPKLDLDNTRDKCLIKKTRNCRWIEISRCRIVQNDVLKELNSSF